jgi:hypothetical protein
LNVQGVTPIDLAKGGPVLEPVGAEYRVAAPDQRLRPADLAVTVLTQPSMIAEVASRLVYLMIVRVLSRL